MSEKNDDIATKSFKDLLNNPIVIVLAAFLGSGVIGGGTATWASASEVRTLEQRITTAEEQQRLDREKVISLHIELIEIKSDVKSVLREVRRMVPSSSTREGDTRDPQ